MYSWNRISLCVATLALGCSAAAPQATPPPSTTPSATTPPPQDVDAELLAPAAPSIPATTPLGEPVCPGYVSTKQALFGDLHSHTMMSADAYGMGTRNDPYDAYQFARAQRETTVSPGSATPGPTLGIGTALDFAAVTDHSEWLATTYACESYPTPGGTPVDSAQPFASCSLFLNQGTAGVAAVTGATGVIVKNCGANSGAPGEETTAACTSVTQSAWQYEQAAADDNNEPCTFTTLKAYEWTGTDSSTGGMLHKNVIFGNDTVPDRPYDYLDYPLPTDLWTALDSGCTGDCQALTIPHNSNLSEGSAFLIPTTAKGVQQMETYQKLVEVYQHKGSSECVPKVGETQCSFEQLDHQAGDPPQPNPQSFVRTGLEDGLAAYAATPAAGNPLMLGIISSSDDHNAMTGHVTEGDFTGHLGLMDDDPADRLTNNLDYGSGGLVGVWAYQNTRLSVFDALKNRETFGTSGTRITPRMFATWKATNYCTNGGFPAQVISDGGTPMGSQLGKATTAGSYPWIVVNASKDQNDISEVDIIKASIVNGSPVESIQTFKTTDAVSPISATTPCVHWQDRAFDPTSPTFYYVRVLEVPSPRWSQSSCVDAAAKGETVSGCEAGGTLSTATIQERAWTSPVWSLP